MRKEEGRMYGMDMYQALYGYALAYTASAEKYGSRTPLGCNFCLEGAYCSTVNGFTLGELEEMHDRHGFEYEANDGFIVGHGKAWAGA